MMKSIRVRLKDADPPPMVQDYRALFAGTRRFLGLKFDPSLGPNGGFASTGDVIELPADEFLHEYLLAIRQGDLVAEDAETAALAGVPFVAEPKSLFASKEF